MMPRDTWKKSLNSGDAVGNECLPTGWRLLEPRESNRRIRLTVTLDLLELQS